jgi:hypothetical protein
MLVMARQRRASLLDALASCGIELLPVCDCNEARRMPDTQPAAQVVVTDTALPDGDWRRVLEMVVQGRGNIEVVVSLRLSGHTIWTDVLEHGGHEVLVEPYQHGEVQRIRKTVAPTEWYLHYRHPFHPNVCRSRRLYSGFTIAHPSPGSAQIGIRLCFGRFSAKKAAHLNETWISK